MEKQGWFDSDISGKIIWHLIDKSKEIISLVFRKKLFIALAIIAFAWFLVLSEVIQSARFGLIVFPWNTLTFTLEVE